MEYDCCTRPKTTANQNMVCNKSSVLIGWFWSTFCMSVKHILESFMTEYKIFFFYKIHFLYNKKKNGYYKTNQWKSCSITSSFTCTTFHVKFMGIHFLKHVFSALLSQITKNSNGKSIHCKEQSPWKYTTIYFKICVIIKCY